MTLIVREAFPLYTLVSRNGQLMRLMYTVYDFCGGVLVKNPFSKTVSKFGHMIDVPY